MEEKELLCKLFCQTCEFRPVALEVVRAAKFQHYLLQNHLAKELATDPQRARDFCPGNSGLGKAGKPVTPFTTPGSKSKVQIEALAGFLTMEEVSSMSESDCKYQVQRWREGGREKEGRSIQLFLDQAGSMM